MQAIKREVEQSICAVCELVVQVVESYVTNNANEQQIQAKLDQVCGDLPSPYNGECTLIVNTYLPQIIQYIQDDENPAQLCAQLNLCTSNTAVALPVKREVEQSICAVCELVVQVVESYVANNATEQQIQAKLDQVCGYLPAPYNGECTLIVNTYLPQIIQYIQNDENPAQLCAQLNLCTSKMAVDVKREVEQSVCSVCQLVVQVVESYITNNATDQQIEAKLDQVCGDLPAPYNGECTLIVNAYLPQIIQYIQNNEQPATLCAQLGLCSSMAVAEKRDVPGGCGVCMVGIRAALAAPADVACQIPALQGACKLAPGLWKYACVLAVQAKCQFCKASSSGSACTYDKLASAACGKVGLC